MKAPVIFLTLAASAALTAPPVRADDPAVPDAGFPSSRYEALWTKSPFAVATSEAAPESPDYMLVGIANVDGIFYASVIDAHNQEHFLISSDKPNRGLTLTSITRNHDDTYAAVQKDGQSITLKLEAPPPMAAVPGAPSATTVVMPGVVTQQLPMPGAASSFSTANGARPPTRFHRPLIHLPPAPAQQQQPTPAPTPPAPPPSK